MADRPWSADRLAASAMVMPTSYSAKISHDQARDEVPLRLTDHMQQARPDGDGEHAVNQNATGRRSCHAGGLPAGMPVPVAAGVYRACVAGPSCSAIRAQGQPQRWRPGSAAVSGHTFWQSKSACSTARGSCITSGRAARPGSACRHGGRTIHADYDPIRSPTAARTVSRHSRSRFRGHPAPPEAFSRRRLLVSNCRYILRAALGASAVGG
jgi:hypothetical protein